MRRSTAESMPAQQHVPAAQPPKPPRWPLPRRRLLSLIVLGAAAALLLLAALLRLRTVLQLHERRSRDGVADAGGVQRFSDGVVCVGSRDSYHAIGYEAAVTDMDMQPLYRDNLEPDVDTWRARVRKRGRRFEAADLQRQLMHLLWSPYVGVIVVQRGTVHVFHSSQMIGFARKRMVRLAAQLQALAPAPGDAAQTVSGGAAPSWAGSNRQGGDGGSDGSRSGGAAGLSSSLLLFNAEDVPVCTRLGNCGVPVFTLFKRKGNATAVPRLNVERDPNHGGLPVQALAATEGATSTEAGVPTNAKISTYTEMPADPEILLPNFNQEWGRLCFFQWDDKNSTALLRASIQVTMDANCTRAQLAWLADSSPEAAKLLDIGVIANHASRRVPLPPRATLARFLPMHAHARWRFVLNTDGHTASSRLGHLLGLDSVVVKERSPWLEFYYRSLQPGVDHLEFGSAEELLHTLRRAASRDSERAMRRVAAAGQRFAYRYLHTHAKALYVREAIARYNTLFEGLEGFVEQLNLTGGQASLRDLVLALSDATGVPLL